MNQTNNFCDSHWIHFNDFYTINRWNFLYKRNVKYFIIKLIK